MIYEDREGSKESKNKITEDELYREGESVRKEGEHHKYTGWVVYLL